MLRCQMIHLVFHCKGFKKKDLQIAHQRATVLIIPAMCDQLFEERSVTFGRDVVKYTVISSRESQVIAVTNIFCRGARIPRHSF